jgi:hypothetical protein
VEKPLQQEEVATLTEDSEVATTVVKVGNRTTKKTVAKALMAGYSN